MNAETLVIGLGNAYRHDDGVGILVAGELKAQDLPGTRIELKSGEGTELMDAWEGFNRVILIDAVSSGGKAGTIHRLEAHKQPIPSKFFHYSTHAFSIAEAVEMARALGKLPEEMLIFGIEGADYSAGEGLSVEVKASAQTVSDEVKTLCMNSHS